MILDMHGADWRQWIIHNISRQCDPLDMIDRMVEKVWSREQAIAAIDIAMQLSGKNSDWKADAPKLPEHDFIKIGDRDISIMMRKDSPKSYMIDGLLSSEECQELIEFSFNRGMNLSSVVDSGTGDSIEHRDRTSTNTFLKRGETSLISSIEERLSILTSWPIERGEGLQILRYQTGQQYKAHFDSFDVNLVGGKKHLERGGQRLTTTIIYLSSPISGGETMFPTSDLKLKPRVGGAVLFHNLDPLGRIDRSSLHAGNPVIEGEKIVATYWQRESSFI